MDSDLDGKRDLITIIYYLFQIEHLVKRFFPLILLLFLLTELLLGIWPALNVRGSNGPRCLHIDDSFATERKHGWLYLVLFPYGIPLLLCIFPVILLAIKVRAKTCLNRQWMSEAKITLATIGSFFLFHLLYYLLMLCRELEALTLDRPEWHRVLGKNYK